MHGFKAAILLYLSPTKRKDFRKLKKKQLSILPRVVNFATDRIQLSVCQISAPGATLPSQFLESCPPSSVSQKELIGALTLKIVQAVSEYTNMSYKKLLCSIKRTVSERFFINFLEEINKT